MVWGYGLWLWEMEPHRIGLIGRGCRLSKCCPVTGSGCRPATQILLPYMDFRASALWRTHASAPDPAPARFSARRRARNSRRRADPQLLCTADVARAGGDAGVLPVWEDLNTCGVAMIAQLAHRASIEHVLHRDAHRRSDVSHSRTQCHRKRKLGGRARRRCSMYHLARDNAG